MTYPRGVVVGMPPGTWGEWVTGIVTALAVLLTGVALKKDIDARQHESFNASREAAKRLSAQPPKPATTMKPSDDYMTSFPKFEGTWTVDVVNGHDEPFYRVAVTLTYPPDYLTPTAETVRAISANGSNLYTFNDPRGPLPVGVPERPLASMTFRDVYGQEWTRDLATGRLEHVTVGTISRWRRIKRRWAARRA